MAALAYLKLKALYLENVIFCFCLAQLSRLLMLDESKNVSKALAGVFAESSNLIVIGLTGRTGSGCSTAARILESQRIDLPEAGDSYYSGNEARKFRIIKKYVDQH
ncbi:MAG TPA: hypothetical protein VL002_14410, partial [Candidimonas sp.]|nr:hypothetical protein [Candidimonas sp.]